MKARPHAGLDGLHLHEPAQPASRQRDFAFGVSRLVHADGDGLQPDIEAHRRVRLNAGQGGTNPGAEVHVRRACPEQLPVDRTGENVHAAVDAAATGEGLEPKAVLRRRGDRIGQQQDVLEHGRWNVEAGSGDGTDGQQFIREQNRVEHAAREQPRIGNSAATRRETQRAGAVREREAGLARIAV